MENAHHHFYENLKLVSLVIEPGQTELKDELHVFHLRKAA